MCWALGNDRNREVKKGVDFPNSRSGVSKGTEGSPCRTEPRNFTKSWTWRNSKGHGLGRVRGSGVFSTLHLAPAGAQTLAEALAQRRQGCLSRGKEGQAFRKGVEFRGEVWQHTEHGSGEGHGGTRQQKPRRETVRAEWVASVRQE